MPTKSLDLNEGVFRGQNLFTRRARTARPADRTGRFLEARGAFTRTAAQALAPRLRVNAIGPGPTLQGAKQSDEHYAAQRANTVLQRGSNPEDICAALGYFLDAPGVTGQLLCVDGGQDLLHRRPDRLHGHSSAPTWMDGGPERSLGSGWRLPGG